MATARLSLHDKSQIARQFKRVLERSLNNKPFVLQKEEVFPFGISCLPEEVAEKYTWLHNNFQKLVHAASWHPDIDITAPHPTEPDVKSVFRITVDGTLPLDPTTCPDTHPKYQEILEWARWYADQRDQIVQAAKYIDTLVDCCTTAGQVKRLLPPETMQYIPQDLRNSLCEAERKSRIPAAWIHSEINTAENQEQFMQTLTLGAISLDTPDWSPRCSRTDIRQRT